MIRLRSGDRESELEKELEMDFSRALVRVSVSRATASEIQESAKVGRNIQGSMVARFSDDAIRSRYCCLCFPPNLLSLLPNKNAIKKTKKKDKASKEKNHPVPVIRPVMGFSS